METFTVELTKDEILLLQKNLPRISGMGGYQWETDIAEGLDKKIQQAYAKPELSQKEFEVKIQKERNSWIDSGEAIANQMARAEEYRLRYYNTIIEGVKS